MAQGVWVSGEICEVVGEYCSRCCKGVATKRFVDGDIFLFCEHCGKKLKWQRSFSDTLPIDTHETNAGDE